MLHNLKKFSVFCITLAVGSMVFADMAHAVRVSIQRIVFEGNTRSQVVNIINDSDEEQIYRIGWRNYRMTEDRMLEEIKENTPEALAGIDIAEPYLKYAPRRVTVPAGHSQQVRVISRVPSDLPEGEYRSHMYVAPEPKPPELSEEEKAKAQQRPVIKITTLTGISFPVIIRKGETSASARFENGRLAQQDGGMLFTVDLLKEGNRSLFGDLDFVCVQGGKEVVVKQAIGFAVYAEVPKRSLSYQIPYPDGGAAACPTLRLVYKAHDEDTQYTGKEIAGIDVSS